MRSILWSVTLAALLAGCTTKEQSKLLEHYEAKKNYHKQLLKTEKVQLYDGNLTKVMLTATYLNAQTPSNENNESERFIVGLYVDDDLQEQEAFDFNLTLNGHAPTSIVPLKKRDPRLEEISFVADWSQFFLITFPHTDATRFDLLFESEQYGKGVLHFAKKAKYTFTKKAF
jgi:hypothetical protein